MATWLYPATRTSVVVAIPASSSASPERSWHAAVEYVYRSVPRTGRRRGRVRGIDGKVVLVTGAGAGIGRASALAFAGEGARVAVADVDENSGPETVRLIEAEGG